MITPMAPDISPSVKEISEDAIDVRRDIHKHPELGFEEERTAGIVSERLADYGLEVTEGVAETGVVGILEGKKPGPTVLLRADMDALPIEEETDAPYRSTVDGVMHACGHDAHTAVNLHVARLLSENRDEVPGTIKFIFQPAEEGPGGAKPMIEEGVLENPDVDAAFGLHMWNPIDVGTVGVREGPLLACADEFEVTITGEGGHGAAPHEAVDPITCASNVISTLQTIVSREVDPLTPAVLTVGKLEGGTRFNIIPDEVYFEGTVRTYDNDLRQSMPDRIKRICTNTAEAMNCEADVTYNFYYPPTINDAEMAGVAHRAASKVVDQDDILDDCRTLGGEDFSFFLEEVPGCFVFIGSRNEEKDITAPHHSARFDIDERAIPIGIEVMKETVLQYLREHGNDE